MDRNKKSHLPQTCGTGKKALQTDPAVFTESLAPTLSQKSAKQYDQYLVTRAIRICAALYQQNGRFPDLCIITSCLPSRYALHFNSKSMLQWLHLAETASQKNMTLLKHSDEIVQDFHLLPFYPSALQNIRNRRHRLFLILSTFIL